MPLALRPRLNLRLKFVLRRQLKNKNVSQEHKDAIRLILNNHSNQVKLNQKVHELTQKKNAPKLVGDSAESDRPFLDWIMAHWEEILKFILTILGLFMTPAPPRVAKSKPPKVK